MRYGRPIELTVDGETKTHWVTATDVDSALDEIGVSIVAPACPRAAGSPSTAAASTSTSSPPSA